MEFAFRSRIARIPPPPWHIVTGEYPPARGGVADYTRSVARALATAGDEVHVWAPAEGDELVDELGVHLHPLARGFGPRGLFALSRDFAREKGPRRLLLQYVPQAFGFRGMNLPFCAWVASLREAQVWVMFHEVRVQWEPPWRLRRAVLAAATRTMAALVATRADRTFVSIPDWDRLLHSMTPRRQRATWSPIPSNLPTEVSPESKTRIRARLHPDPTAPLIGHFGTYGSLIAAPLGLAALKLLKTDPRRRLLLLGRDSDMFAREFAGEPAIAARIVATGELEAPEVAAHLAACDVLVQPYADGISTRRTTAMAGLALGVPIATNEGPRTEAVWRESGAVELADAADGVAEAAEILLRDRARAAAMGERGQRLYQSRFSLEHTVRMLREDEGGSFQ